MSFTRSGTPRALPDLMSAKPTFTLAELAEWLATSIPIGTAVTFTGVCTDSRAVEPGDLYLVQPGPVRTGSISKPKHVGCCRGGLRSCRDDLA